ncbi:hypothetical protein FEFB_16390 [Fructobacillus sp. EFB-N1]|uniref:Panacea domain-containing protein n=1 Tax=Fructobacillus sp. EFB-N1 TaxID=1658766 RepID=UPI00064DA1F2|nr:type II toxin-antitoxin system antitoxin SocA domain-containing protein [Fructobacillus sp. EFB-N1]KMK52630.1 hypothetical protein FEFB_16390 [Fructobacillus sp. EFB-N1]
MVFHLLAVSKQKESFLIYDYVTDNVEEVISESRKISISSIKNFVIRFVTTDSTSFESVKEIDPYFEGAQVIKKRDDFIAMLQEDLKLTSVDVAAYIQKKYCLTRFQLLKVMYYLYADYLIEHGKPLFDAKFEVWDRGPVESEVYQIDKHHSLEWHQAGDVRSKTLKSEYVLKTIDDSVKKYADFFKNNGIKGYEFDDATNPTHRSGTPWSIVKERDGKNAIIDDEVIKAHHDVEKISI